MPPHTTQTSRVTTTVDVTQTFWRYVATIAQLKHDRLEKSRVFDMVFADENASQMFQLQFDNNVFVRQNMLHIICDVYQYLLGQQANAQCDEHQERATDEIQLLRCALSKVNMLKTHIALMQQINSLSLSSPECMCV